MTDHVEILLIEDNDADIVLVTEALKDAKVYNNLTVVRDGQEALDHLSQDFDSDSSLVKPGLILLDLYLPKVNGLEILKFIKDHPKLKTTPVVVMTSSYEETDVAKAYECQANSYVVKPLNFEQLVSVINAIEDFWLSVVKLPK